MSILRVKRIGLLRELSVDGVRKLSLKRLKKHWQELANAHRSKGTTEFDL